MIISKPSHSYQRPEPILKEEFQPLQDFCEVFKHGQLTPRSETEPSEVLATIETAAHGPEWQDSYLGKEGAEILLP